MLRRGRIGRKRKPASKNVVRIFVIFCLCLCACTRSTSPDNLYAEGSELLKRGRLEEALAVADSGFKKERSWRFRLLRARILIAVDPHKAIDALDTLEGAPTPEHEARRQMYRGWAAYLIADYPNAVASLRRAAQLAAPLNQPLLAAEIELDEGTLAAQQGDIAGAQHKFRHAFQIAVETSDLDLQSVATGSLGWLSLQTHHPEDAIYWFEKQRTTAEKLGRVRLVANALGNLGASYHRLGDYEMALKYFSQAEPECRKNGDRGEQQIWLGNIGNVYLDRGDYAMAVEPYKEALSIAKALGEKSWMASWLSNLALASINLGQFDAAEAYNREALELKQSLRSSSVSYPRVNEALIAAGRGDFTNAERLYQAILADPSDDPTPTLEAQSGLAELLVKMNQPDRADAQFRAAISLVERRRSDLTRDEYKLSYLSSLIHFYQRYVDFLVSRGKTEAALEAAESSRARLLDEKLHSANTKSRVVRATELKQLARASKTALLSYWLAEDRSFLWVITPQDIQLHVLPPEKQIAALVEAYRTFIENLRDPLESELPAGRKLAEILLGPVSADRITVVPDRALHSLNLETLPDPKDPSRYLIDRVSMQVAPSLGVLLQPHRPATGARSLLLIGNPEPAVEEYPKLPFAAKEVEMIGRNFAPDQRVIIDGPRAYPSAYREAAPSRFSWIHFAAHASANRESPLDSALILSAHDSAYALPAREVMDVPLNADLVTLSACRSAGSKTYSGEGLVGLSWAFLRAGAKNVVAGLWDVTDMSTATLMSDFYEQLTKNVPPAEALRAAKLRMIRSKSAYRKPFYWGPFQLYAGAGR